MKNPQTIHRHHTAFTLVELLVVVVIIASLAALAFTLGPKMRKRAEVAKSVQNKRQIGGFMGVSASEYSFQPPAPGGCSGTLSLASGAVGTYLSVRESREIS